MREVRPHKNYHECDVTGEGFFGDPLRSKLQLLHEDIFEEPSFEEDIGDAGLSEATLPHFGRCIAANEQAAGIFGITLDRKNFGQVRVGGTDPIEELQGDFFGLSSSVAGGASYSYGMVLSDLYYSLDREHGRLSSDCFLSLAEDLAKTAEHCRDGLGFVQCEEKGQIKIRIVNRVGEPVQKLPEERNFSSYYNENLSGERVAELPRNERKLAASLFAISQLIKDARDRLSEFEIALSDPFVGKDTQTASIHRAFNEISSANIDFDTLRPNRVAIIGERLSWFKRSRKELLKGMTALRSCGIGDFKTESMLRESEGSWLRNRLIGYTNIKHGQFKTALEYAAIANATFAVMIPGLIQMSPLDAAVREAPVVGQMYETVIDPLWKVSSVALLLYFADKVPQTVLKKLQSDAVARIERRPVST